MYTLQLFSFDLSLSPKVVRTLTPAIERSLQRTGFALGAAEGAGSPSRSSQLSGSSTKQLSALNKLVVEFRSHLRVLLL